MKKILYTILFHCICLSIAIAQPLMKTDNSSSRGAIVRKAVVPQNNRDKIVDEYNAEYGYRINLKQTNWTGNVATCAPGNISTIARDGALKRLNYYRTLVGTKPLPKWIDSLSLKCQAAALLCKANKQLSHTPPTTWTCYNSAASAACGASNLTLSYNSEPRYAIDQYIEDAGANNTAAGHRRWLFYSQAKNYAFGSSIDSNNVCTNALWVLPTSFSWPPPPPVNDTIPEYIAFPPAGFVPKKLMTSYYGQYPFRWTFSIPDAQFDSTSVQLFNEMGQPLPIVTNVISNGYGDNTIVFEPVASNIDITSSKDAVYKVKINKVKVDGKNKNYEYDVVLVENKKYKPTLTSVGSNCNKNDGSASVQYTPGYKSLKWSNGATSETIANLATGKYYVSITDKMNVVWKDSVEVKAKSTPLTLSTVVVDATCDKNNASISLSTNATAKTYLWSNAATTAKIENLATGKYSATVTSSEDCISTISVDVLPKKVGAASVTANNTTCGKTDGNTEAILTGSTAKSFLWSNNATTAKLSNLSGGTYSVTITDENDCKITAQNKVIALENPIVSITKTDATCGLKNGTITATATGNVKFAWDNNQKTPVLEQLAVGTYTVTVTNNDACTATQFSTINALPVGILSLLGKNTTCNKNDASVEVTIKGGAAIKTYLWSNGATTPQISNLSGGTYTVSITDANACILTEKTTVKSLLSPIVNLGLDISIKPSQSLVFDAGVGANYLWSTGANSQKQGFAKVLYLHLHQDSLLG